MNYDFADNSDEKYLVHHHAVYNYAFCKYHPVNVFDNVCFNGYDKLNSADVSMRINHYFTKSLQEYAEKKNKGDVYFQDNPHDMDYFFAHEQNCQAVDYSAYKYLIKLKLAMRSKTIGKES